jgi:hypothetical protein
MSDEKLLPGDAPVLLLEESSVVRGLKQPYLAPFDQRTLSLSGMGLEYDHLVVHCQRDLYQVYIGRPMSQYRLTGPWGNPFKRGKGVNKSAVIKQYREWLLAQPDLVAKVKRELRGKVLGCWCAPDRCHGHVLAEIANVE